MVLIQAWEVGGGVFRACCGAVHYNNSGILWRVAIGGVMVRLVFQCLDQ